MDIEPRFSFTSIRQRRENKILLVASADASNYIHSSVNSADMSTWNASTKNPNYYALWLGGPKFLLDGNLEPEPLITNTVVHKTTVGQEPCGNRETGLD